MGTPKKRHSITRRLKRRSHHALTKACLVNCTNCGEPTLPHRVCAHCSYYKGKRILNVEA